MQKTEIQALQVTQTRKAVLVSLFSAVAFVLQYIEFVVPFMPSFLKLDVSTLPAIVGGLVLGPGAGVMIELLKNTLHFLFKNSDGLLIGEIANFVAGACFVLAILLVHRRMKNTKGFVAGLALGTLLMTILMSVANYFVLIPAYAAVYQVSLEALLEMLQMESLWSLIVYGIVPFNLLKGLVISLVAYPIYVKLLPRIR